MYLHKDTGEDTRIIRRWAWLPTRLSNNDLIWMCSYDELQARILDFSGETPRKFTWKRYARFKDLHIALPWIPYKEQDSHDKQE